MVTSVHENTDLPNGALEPYYLYEPVESHTVSSSGTFEDDSQDSCRDFYQQHGIEMGNLS